VKVNGINKVLLRVVSGFKNQRTVSSGLRQVFIDMQLLDCFNISVYELNRKTKITLKSEILFLSIVDRLNNQNIASGSHAEIDVESREFSS